MDNQQQVQAVTKSFITSSEIEQTLPNFDLVSVHNALGAIGVVGAEVSVKTAKNSQTNRMHHQVNIVWNNPDVSVKEIGNIMNVELYRMGFADAAGGWATIEKPLNTLNITTQQQQLPAIDGKVTKPDCSKEQCHG